jgi:hypothetical protein
MDNEVTARLSPKDRERVRRLAQNVASVFQIDNSDPQLAIVVLLNVMGSIIASRFEAQSLEQVAMVQRTLPLYVAVYSKRERPIITGQ